MTFCFDVCVAASGSTRDSSSDDYDRDDEDFRAYDREYADLTGRNTVFDKIPLL